ncbi:hypothetical protein AHF37_10989 [Paragonimus kellicotti]|nr:hypothetical protein AHF37_10989 [Paragonimus kellicotti]
MITFHVECGKAWCVVAGGFVANFVLGGLAKSYSLVMEAFQEEFQSGSAYLMLAGCPIHILMYSLSLIGHYISQRRPLYSVDSGVGQSQHSNRPFMTVLNQTS